MACKNSLTEVREPEVRFQREGQHTPYELVNLFDEIDQALDSTHRAAVAALIQRQAESAQFITSTFRPEMVHFADRFYGIGHQHKIPNVHTMTREESLEFIANIMAKEEGV